MAWVAIAVGIAGGALAAHRLHPAVAACLGVAAIGGFFAAVLYALNHYDECGDCNQTTGAHVTGFIAFFCFGLAAAAIVLGGLKFFWMLAARRSR